MPLYRYQCSNNHHCSEFRVVNDRNIELFCEECGEEMKLEICAPSFIFKGSGFYETDYKNKEEIDVP